MGNPSQLPIGLQRVLCAVNRTIFRLDAGGEWTGESTPNGKITLQNNDVAELLRLGHIDVTSASTLVPTDSGRELYRACAASGHAIHL